MTFTPRYNVYADKNGVATHKAEDNTLVIAAGSPVSLDEAKRLKLPELEAVVAQKLAETADPLAALQPAHISASDAKLLEKAARDDEINAPKTAPAKVETAPKTAQGDK